MPRYTAAQSPQIDALERRMREVTQCAPDRAGVPARTLLGCTPRTYYHWRSEAVPLPPAVGVLLRVVLATLTDEQLRAVLDQNTRALCSVRPPEQRNDE